MKSKFKKVTTVRLPFDMRSKEPEGNYGIGGLYIWFVLIGPLGAVQYLVNFPVYLPSVDTKKFDMKIIGHDVGYHSYKPEYEGHTKMDCYHLEGGSCYYDGSALKADAWTDIILSTKGSPPEDTLWKMLEDEYNERFGEL